MNIWEVMYDKFLFNKSTITLFESFAGIGSQHIALKQLSKEFNFKLDVVGISEIDKYAIQSYNAIHGKTKNYGSICDIQEIPQVDIFTYSFPCQDISLAGKRKGFSKGSGTRSGLLWEVERLLENQEKIGKLPQVLLMENVKALVGMNFKDDFIQWQLKLEELGYKNYWEVLNAKNYGIPQNRERVFMVSILGEYHYTFPKPFPLKLRLKDMLEDEVDEKYYLSEKMIKGMQTTKFHQYSLDKQLKNTKGIADTILARFEGAPQVIKIQKETNETLCLNSKVNGKQPKIQDRVYDSEGVSTAITTSFHPSILIPEATKKGIKREPQFEARKDKLSNSILASNGKNMIIYDDYNSKIRKDQDTIGTITTNIGVSAERNGYKLIENNLRIRKLTPKECFRLMGFSDSDFDKAASVCSNSQLYRQAGNSIVVDVLYYIFKEMIKER